MHRRSGLGSPLNVIMLTVECDQFTSFHLKIFQNMNYSSMRYMQVPATLYWIADRFAYAAVSLDYHTAREDGSVSQ